MSANPASVSGGAIPSFDFRTASRNSATQPANWLAFYTSSKHEKNVARYLGYEAIEYYLPLIKSRRSWRNRARVELELPLFPGYIFAHIERERCSRILRLPGVISAIGTVRNPAIVDESEIDSLREGLAERNGQPHPLLIVGRRVRICCGAFAGREGILVRKDPNWRVVLTLQSIMRSFSVEVDGNEVEMVN